MAKSDLARTSRMMELANLGQLEAATALYRKVRLDPGSPSDDCGSFFFFGILLTRKSLYKRALFIFGLIKKAAQTSSDARVHFFRHQSSAFYLFYRGFYRKGYRYSSRALEFASELEDPLLSILAHDLAGHYCMAVGKIRKGLLELEQGKTIAQSANLQTFLQAIEISILRFRAAFGIDGSQSFIDLENAVESVKLGDIYSFSELGLELARQLILRGRADDAKTLLDQVCEHIYRAGIQRQTFTLNMRYAYLQCLAGERMQAFNLLNISLQSLDPEVDRHRFAQANGFMTQIKASAPTSEPLVIKGIYPHQRIMDRAQGVFSANRGEDPLGDLLDDIKRGIGSGTEKAIELGYLGLLPQLMGTGKFPDPNQVLFALDLVPGLFFTAFRGNVILHTRKLDGLLRKLLFELSKGWISKAELISRIWGYKYHPLRHDSLVYNSVTSLRKLLGNHADLLESGEEGYRIRPNAVLIRFSEFRNSVAPTPTITEPTSESHEFIEFTPEPGLNHRQILILEALLRTRFLTVSESAKILRCSIPTACRDLSALLKMGKVVRIGNTRATRYALNRI